MEKSNLIKPGDARNGQLMARALNHPVRSAILEIIADAGETDVTSIYTHQTFRVKGRYLEQSQCSQHLAILRKANLVNTRRVGKQILYSINQEVYLNTRSLLESLSSLYKKGATQVKANGHATRMSVTSLR